MLTDPLGESKMLAYFCGRIMGQGRKEMLGQIRRRRRNLVEWGSDCMQRIQRRKDWLKEDLCGMGFWERILEGFVEWFYCGLEERGKPFDRPQCSVLKEACFPIRLNDGFVHSHHLFLSKFCNCNILQKYDIS